jgi:hypothetical protein
VGGGVTPSSAYKPAFTGQLTLGEITLPVSCLYFYYRLLKQIFVSASISFSMIYTILRDEFPLPLRYLAIRGGHICLLFLLYLY